jgi:hypothetical protein
VRKDKKGAKEERFEQESWLEYEILLNDILLFRWRVGAKGVGY